jgi:hypothetical protein
MLMVFEAEHLGSCLFYRCQQIVVRELSPFGKHHLQSSSHSFRGEKCRLSWYNYT